jgi:hypothetical protein
MAKRSKVSVKAVRKGPYVDIVFDRMVEILTLIKPTQAKEAVIEYSALLCAATTIMTTVGGIEPTNENLSTLLAKVMERLAPILEELLDEVKP